MDSMIPYILTGSICHKMKTPPPAYLDVCKKAAAPSPACCQFRISSADWNCENRYWWLDICGKHHHFIEMCFFWCKSWKGKKVLQKLRCQYFERLIPDHFEGIARGSCPFQHDVFWGDCRSTASETRKWWPDLSLLQSWLSCGLGRGKNWHVGHARNYVYGLELAHILLE